MGATRDRFALAPAGSYANYEYVAEGPMPVS